jgi:ribosome production factor 1
MRPADIKNKMKRAEIRGKQFYENKAAKRKRRDARRSEAERLGDAAPPKQIPHTLDNTREVDDTIVGPDDEEVMGDEADDEFAQYFSGAVAPKLMVTTSPRPSVKVYPVIAELLNVFPGSFFYKRGTYALKQIVGWATKHGFTHLLVLSERNSEPAG